MLSVSHMGSLTWIIQGPLPRSQLSLEPLKNETINSSRFACREMTSHYKRAGYRKIWGGKWDYVTASARSSVN